jgi:mitogen-activated protein kinase kinase kinase
MDPSQRGVRFQGYPPDTADIGGDISRNQTPVPPRSVSNTNQSSLHPPSSPHPRTTVPGGQQQPQQQIPRSAVQGYFPMELPIDYGVPSIVEEGGFPFETPSPNVGVAGYSWSPMSPPGSNQAYYPNGQFFAGYDQEPPQSALHPDTERSPTDRNNAGRTRPTINRLPSNTYFPIRHPESGGHDQFSTPSSSAKPTFLRRVTSQRGARGAKIRPTRTGYLQKMQSDPDDDYLQHSGSGSYRRDPEMESEDGSMGDEYREYDNEFDVDKELITNLDLTPSAEDLENPEYVERVEWQNRLAQVLRGDVVTSEKKRIAEPSGPEDEKAHRYEMWLGIRAKAYGRSLADQRRVLIEGRAYMDRVIEDVLTFSVKTYDEGITNAKTPEQQVDEILARWDRCEALYSSLAALRADKPATADGSEFDVTLSALVAWSNVTKNVHTSLQILRAWTGQDDLDLTRRGGPSTPGKDISLNINDESSFIERILKENRIEQTFSKAILSTLNKQVYKAKETVEANHAIFDRMRLPSFLGDVQLLVNFPTKLIEEALKIRLAYARKLRDPGLIVIEQLIDDFALCMKVAVGIKKEYLMVTEPSEGWNLVSWVDDSVCNFLVSLTTVRCRLIGRSKILFQITSKEIGQSDREGVFQRCRDSGRSMEFPHPRNWEIHRRGRCCGC